MTKGIAAAVVAYTLWGILPVYWKAVQAVPALEIMSHRTVWSFLFLLVVLTARRQWTWLQRARRNPRLLLTFA
jgi:chloramphenicol-sensitive protein RarD